MQAMIKQYVVQTQLYCRQIILHQEQEHGPLFREVVVVLRMLLLTAVLLMEL